MATEEQKKARQIRLFNDIIFGFGKGLYDLFGDSAVATVDTIGEDVLEEMEHELGLEIHGEDPQDILMEIERLLIDEYGLVESATIKITDHEAGHHEVHVVYHGDLLFRATREMVEAGMPPLTAVPFMLAKAALDKRLGKKARFKKIEIDNATRSVNIEFDVVD